METDIILLALFVTFSRSSAAITSPAVRSTKRVRIPLSVRLRA
jgi:hypothetical protein